MKKGEAVIIRNVSFVPDNILFIDFGLYEDGRKAAIYYFADYPASKGTEITGQADFERLYQFAEINNLIRHRPVKFKDPE